MKTNERIEWIDLAKGIAILCVILGHTLSWSDPNEKFYRDMIYSFHMPLFFVLSAAASKRITDASVLISKVEKSFLRLVVPVIIYTGLTTVQLMLQAGNLADMGGQLIDRINAFVYSNGVAVTVRQGTVSALGITWFMITLFFAKNFFSYMCMRLVTDKKILIASIACGIAGMVIGHFQWLPFTLDMVLQIMPFFYFGSKLKDFHLDKHKVFKMIGFGVAWIGIYLFYRKVTGSYLDLSWRWHPLYPLSDIGALFGTMFVVMISVLLERFKFSIPLKYLGKNTFVFFWIHTVDYLWQWIWQRTDNVMIVFALRILTNLVVFAVVQCIISFVKKRLAQKRSI